MTNSNNKPQPEGVIISQPFKRKPMIKKFLKKKYILVLVAVVLVAGGLLTLFLKLHKEPEPIALQVGKYSYTQSEYDKRIAQAKDIKVSAFEARRALREALASRQAADDLKIIYPTDQSTLNTKAIHYYKLNIGNPSVNDYQRDTTYTPLIKSLVSLGAHGGYKVGYVNFPFARYLFGFADDDKGDPKLYRNNDAMHADITYAKQQAENYRQAYINKKQSIDDIVQAVRADGRLTYGQATNQSDVFILEQNRIKTPLYASGNVVTETLFQEIQKAPIGQPTGILGELWANDESVNIPEIKHGDFMDVAYYFIVVQQKVTARPDLQTQYDKLAKDYAK